MNYDDRPRAGLVTHGLRCPDCGAAVTAAADWSTFPFLGLPASDYEDVVAAFALHTDAHPSCTTVVTEASTDATPGR